MSGEPDDRDVQRALIYGLTAKSRHVWHTDATFRATVTAFAEMLPDMVQGWAIACMREAEGRSAELQRLMREPVPSMALRMPRLGEPPDHCPDAEDRED
jgi:hypothetical protein